MRVIVAFDLDCFYAQVECVARDNFAGPLAVRQKGLFVTSNYAARDLFAKRAGKSMKKCAGLTEAMKVLGDSVVVVNGEDIFPYQRASYDVRDVVARFGPVEKSGLDEFFVDVTESARSLEECEWVGHVIDGEEHEDDLLLRAGTVIASRARARVLAETGLTASAGVSRNKLIAKWAASKNKPDQQTAVRSSAEAQFAAGCNWRDIPGVGRLAIAAIEEHGEVPASCGGLRDLALDLPFVDALWGRDDSEVVPNCEGGPKTVGIEGTWRRDPPADVKRALQTSPKLVNGLLDRLAYHKTRFGSIFTKLTVRWRFLEGYESMSSSAEMPAAVASFLWRQNDETRSRALTALVDLGLRILGTGARKQLGCIGLCATTPVTSTSTTTIDRFFSSPKAPRKREEQDDGAPSPKRRSTTTSTTTIDRYFSGGSPKKTPRKQEEEEPSPKRRISPASWSCGTCTFLHEDGDADFLVCALCAAPRMRQQHAY